VQLAGLVHNPITRVTVSILKVLGSLSRFYADLAAQFLTAFRCQQQRGCAANKHPSEEADAKTKYEICSFL
jgi:hypothetical protein